MPLPSSGRWGALLSATKTSPFGSTKSQRGCSRPLAKPLTLRFGAAVGLPSADHPFAGAILTVGMYDLVGCGIVGFAPTEACSGNFALSPQPASSDVAAPARSKLKSVRMESPTLIELQAAVNRSAIALIKHGQGNIANARAGNPSPLRTFGQVTTIKAPFVGTLSRLAMISI